MYIQKPTLKGGGVLYTEAARVEDSASPYVAFYTDASTRKGYFGFGTGLTDFLLWNEQNGLMRFGTNNAERIRITGAGSVAIGNAAIATSATDGHLHLPACAGVATGVPNTVFTGLVPVVVDSTNKRIMFYSGRWYSIGMEVLTADRTYYVRTDGSDNNDGLTNSSGGAFLTLQKAADAIMMLNANGYNITVQIADGTYNAGLTLGLVTGMGNGALTFQGNASTPSNVVINTTNAYNLHVVGFYPPTAVYFKDMKLTNSGSLGGLRASAGSNVRFSNIDFGACANNHIDTGAFGLITCVGNYAITGGAVNHLSSTGRINKTSAFTVTITGTPNFTGYFAYAGFGGVLQDIGGTFTGSATGTRYRAELNGIINTNGGGANYFPGNVAGSTATGGQYV